MLEELAGMFIVWYLPTLSISIQQLQENKNINNNWVDINDEHGS